MSNGQSHLEQAKRHLYVPQREEGPEVLPTSQKEVQHQSLQRERGG